MTKGELVLAVQKGCDCDLSKRAVEGIIDTTLQTIAKDIKKSGRFPYHSVFHNEDIPLDYSFRLKIGLQCQ